MQPNEVINDPQEDPFSDLTSLKHAQRMDDWGSLIYKYLEDGTLPNDSIKAKRIAVEAQSYVVVNGILHYVQVWRIPNPRVEEKLYIPESLRMEIMQVFHDDLTGGHLSINKVYPKLAKRYFWPGMYAYAKEWIASCLDCASKKSQTNVKRAPLINIPAASRAYERVPVSVYRLSYKTCRGLCNSRSRKHYHSESVS